MAATDLVRIDSATDPALERAPAPALKRILRGEQAPRDLEETREVLHELARRKCGGIPPEVIVEQALQVTEGTDWPTRRAALEALLRRVAFAERDELTIARRPVRDHVLGAYELMGRKPTAASNGRTRRTARPYRTELYGVSPFRGSCDCADYLRGSLGLCKHLLVVVREVCARRGALDAALREGARQKRQAPTLCWDPVRAWTGEGDRLRGLLLTPGDAAAQVARGRLGGWDRTGRLTGATLADLGKRRAALAALLAAHAERKLAAESGALALVEAEHALADRRLVAQKVVPRLLRHLRSLKRSLYPYQLEGVERFLAAQHLLLADDMGLGKTTQAIAACHVLFASGTVQRGLVIVPASLRSQWVREWEATTDTAPITLVEGRADERAELYRRTKAGFLVMSYEQLLRDLGEVHRFAAEVVVLDEAQRIKNWATKSSAYVMTLRPAWRLVLTGTPLENRLEELATILDWVDDVALTPKWRLTAWHTKWDGTGGSERAGIRHLDTLRQRLAPSLVRRVRREVLAQLPPRTDVRVPVELTERQREAHDSVVQDIAALVSAARRRPLRPEEFLKLMSLLTFQRIASNGMAQLEFEEVWPTYARSRAEDALLATMASPKLGELRRLVRELCVDQGRKVVVFSQWRRMLCLCEWAVRDVLAANGMRAVFFTGGESQRQRTENVVELHDDPDTTVMFLSDAGGVGLNLQRAASACINVEVPWNPAVLEQRVGRIYRLGQKLPIDVFNLVSNTGIEARIAEVVGQKQALFTGLFDGTTDEVRFDSAGGFLKDIERLVEPVVVPDVTGATGDTGDAVVAEGGALASEPAAAALLPAPELSDDVGVAVAPTQVSELFSRVRLERTAAGGLRLEAAPEAAAELAALFEGLAAMLRSAHQDNRPGG